MKKTTLSILFVIALNVVTSVSTSAATYTYTFDAQIYTAYDTQNLGGINWAVAATGHSTTDFGFDAVGSKGQRFGLSTVPTSIPTSITMKTSDISGTITAILVRTAGSAPLDATVSVSVGGIAFTVGGIENMPVLGDPKSPYYTFIGSGSGEIAISWSQPTTTKALFIKTIEVTNDLPAGFEKVQNKLVFSVANGKITFNASKGDNIRIYNALGKNILSKTAVQGINSISLTQKGIYILKLNNQITKVIL